MRHMSLEGKITIFKSPTISKIVYLALLILIRNSVLDEVNQTRQTFIWENERAKKSMIHYLANLLKVEGKV